MKLDPKRPFDAWLLRLAAWLVRWLVQLLGLTCRLEIVEGGEHLDALLASGDTGNARSTGAGGLSTPIILAFWHDRAVLAVYLVFQRLIRRGLDATTLISQSRDGELVAHLARHWQMSHIRGSATRGGRRALRQLYRATRAGASPVMIPDGPHGPRYRFKTGVAVLAQMSGAPVLPFGFAASRAWRLRSWDRLIVPKPFSRIVAVVGPPHTVPRDLDTAALEAERVRLQRLLDDVTARAEAALEG